MERTISNSVICYFPTLEGQVDEVRRWMEGTNGDGNVILSSLPPVDWNDDLTPWPAGPIFKKGKSFGGKAEAYLEKLENEIVPAIETELGIIPAERWIIGVSLGGLFAVWAAARTRLFSKVASVSGSFWYPGFTDWLRGQTVNVKEAYLSLGDKETMGKNPHLKDIGAETEDVMNILKDKGVRTMFEWTEGTHFSPVIPRLERALVSLSGRL